VQMRVGLGHDIHRIGSDRKLVIGGVVIEHDCGLIGHSDADVLLHALTDALLGAAGLGDIGEWFPNDDEKWVGADSAHFVKTALEALHNRHWEVANVDCTVFAERPKLSEYKPIIERQLAQLLEVDAEIINVKAKSGEAVGPVGRQEAIAADAIVLLVQNDTDPGS